MLAHYGVKLQDLLQSHALQPWVTEACEYLSFSYMIRGNAVGIFVQGAEHTMNAEINNCTINRAEINLCTKAQLGCAAHGFPRSGGDLFRRLAPRTQNLRKFSVLHREFSASLDMEK